VARYLAVIGRPFWVLTVWLTVILGFGAAGTAAVVRSRVTPVYQASVTVLLQPGQKTETSTYPLNLEQTTNTFVGLLTRRALLRQVIQELHVPDDPAALRRDVTASPRTSSEIVDVKVKHRDPSSAAAIANKLVNDYITQNQAEQQQEVNVTLKSLQTSIGDLDKQITEESKAIAVLQALRIASADQQAQLSNLRQKLSADSAVYANLVKSYQEIRSNQLGKYGTVSVIDPATVPEKPVFPDKRLNALLAGILGVTVAVGLAYLINLWGYAFTSPNRLAA
jgi:uncharacterized protein involved in exopolysaccharide biosynthesis